MMGNNRSCSLGGPIPLAGWAASEI